MQAAIDAANSGATIRVCAGTYQNATSTIADIQFKDLTIVGMGNGPGDTVFDRGGELSRSPVMSVLGSVTLRNLTVTGGNRDGAGGGIMVPYLSSSLTLEDVLVENNRSDRQGGGISSAGALILNAGTRISGNTSTSLGGGIFNDGGTVTFNGDSIVCGNEPENCSFLNSHCSEAICPA